ncbi:unnamed protein product [Echinostoma caproni]|uniref:Structural protein n=1 Tax=Echinostoma caproni TaxID=27848 RepID=A0A183AVC8_9TREM|nr:unnamed protein product [Echinostoma caproni]
MNDQFRNSQELSTEIPERFAETLWFGIIDTTTEPIGALGSTESLFQFPEQETVSPLQNNPITPKISNTASFSFDYKLTSEPGEAIYAEPVTSQGAVLQPQSDSSETTVILDNAVTITTITKNTIVTKENTEQTVSLSSTTAAAKTYLKYSAQYQVITKVAAQWDSDLDNRLSAKFEGLSTKLCDLVRLIQKDLLIISPFTIVECGTILYAPLSFWTAIC